MKKYIIIGGGLAGVTAAMEIKRLESDSLVTIYAKEPYPYYQRPRLWEFIAGEITQEQLYFRPISWYAEKGIDLQLNLSVNEILPEQHQILVNHDRKDSYDQLLLATGADSNLPPFTIDDPGVFALRSLDDAKNIIAYANKCKEVLIIGGGLLGLETGRAFQKRGLRVKIAEFMPYLLPRQLDGQGAGVLQKYLETNGMQIITAASTSKISRKNGQLAVSFQGGREVTTDMVLLSTGIRSQVDPAKKAQLEVKRGVVVNTYLETSTEDIFAAGDAAEFDGVVYGIIPAAVDQGRIAAANMVNKNSLQYTGTVPFTRLKIVGMEFNALGVSNLADSTEGNYTILRQSDPEENQYQRIVIKEGKIIGAILLGNTKNLTPFKTLIESERDVSAVADRLLDPATDLKAIAKGNFD